MPANVAAVIDVPLEIFGGMVSDLTPTDIPQGASPDCQDVAFQIGLVKTRPGLQNAGFATIGSNPTVNYLKTYITQQQVNRMMALDSLGNVYKENPTGTLQTIGTVTPNEYAKSASQFAREYMAFGNGLFGLDIPRQYDDTNFDRVSQVGPGAAPVAIDEQLSAIIAAGPGGATQPFNATIVASPGGASETANLVTITTTGPHGFSPNETVNIAGVAVAAYNGNFTIVSVPSTTTFTYVLGTTGLANSGNGTATSGVAVFTTTTPHGFVPGQLIQIAGVGVAGYNGTFNIFGVTATSFEANLPTGGLANSGGGTATAVGNVTAGKHQLTVSFVTRQGYITAPAPPTSSWTAAGGKRVVVSSIPIGPPNVTKRIISFTLTGGNSFYYISGSPFPSTFPALLIPPPGSLFSMNMVISDNTTTTATFDFTDAILAAGTSADYLFRLVELGECQGTIDYALREFWWGERAKVQNIINFTFDGGFGTDGLGRLFPLGWTEDATNYAGGGDVITNNPTLPVVWGNAYSIKGDGATAIRGLMTQSVYQDINGVSIIQAGPTKGYSVRVRLAKNSTLVAGTVHIHIQSTALAIDVGLDVTAAQLTTAYQEFSAVLTAGITTPPTDLVIKVFADGTPTNNGVFLLDNIEFYLTTQPFNTSLARGSRVEDPESFDGVNGIMQFGENDGTRVTSAFKLRNNLYFVKERSIWQTADDGVNEPAKWTVNPVTTIIGSPSVNGVGIGSDWVVVASRLGLYYYDGGEPQKISQEIQKAVVSNTGALLAGWDNINWQFGYTIWVQIDEKNRRVIVGAPVFGATSPNIVFVLDYRGLDTGAEITQHKSIHISAYTGKIYDIADSRKWTRWNMSVNSSGQIERTDGTFHMFMGNGAGTGKIYDLLDVENFTTPATFSDDGVAINSYYDTYYFLRPQEEEQYQLGSHRKLYRYLTLYIEGQGQPSLTAFPPGDFTGIAIPQSGVPLPVLSSPLFPINITSISRNLLGIVTVVTASPHNVTSAVVIQGTGNAAFDNQTFGNITVINPTAFQFPQSGGIIAAILTGTVNPLIRDIETPTNISTERTKYRVGTNAVGAWFSLRTLTPSIMTDPWAPVRGIN